MVKDGSAQTSSSSSSEEPRHSQQERYKQQCWLNHRTETGTTRLQNSSAGPHSSSSAYLQSTWTSGHHRQRVLQQRGLSARRRQMQSCRCHRCPPGRTGCASGCSHPWPGVHPAWWTGQPACLGDRNKRHRTAAGRVSKRRTVVATYQHAEMMIGSVTWYQVFSTSLGTVHAGTPVSSTSGLILGTS